MQHQFVNVALYKLDGKLDQSPEVYDFLRVAVDGSIKSALYIGTNF